MRTRPTIHHLVRDLPHPHKKPPTGQPDTKTKALCVSLCPINPPPRHESPIVNGVEGVPVLVVVVDVPRPVMLANDQRRWSWRRVAAAKAAMGLQVFADDSGEHSGNVDLIVAKARIGKPGTVRCRWKAYQARIAPA